MWDTINPQGGEGRDLEGVEASKLIALDFWLLTAA